MSRRFFKNIPRTAGIYANANPSIADILAKTGEIKGAFEAFKSRIDARLDAMDADLREQNSRRETAKALGGGASRVDISAVRKEFLSVAAGRVQAALTTSNNPEGGYLVPTEIDRSIGRLIEDESALRRIATVRPIETDEYSRLFNLKGTEAAWVTETESRPDTANSKYAKLTYKAHEMYAQPAATQQVLDDSDPMIASEIEIDIASAFADLESAALINGSGAKTPHGLIGGYNAVANSSWVWGKLGYVATGDASGFVTTTASVSPADCLINLIHSLKAGYRRNAAFLMNDSTAAIVRKWKDNEGRHLWVDSLALGEAPTLLGYPVYTDPNMPDVAAGETPIAFGDFKRGYLIVERKGIRLLIDPYTAKPWVKFYATRRVGGGVQDFAAIKLLKIASS